MSHLKLARYGSVLLAAAAVPFFLARCGENPAFDQDVSTRYKTPGSDAGNDSAGGADAGAADAGGGPSLDANGNPVGAADGAADTTGDLAGSDSGADAGAADGGADSGIDPAVAEQLKRLPKFGLLVNDLECGLCHVTVVGDVASSRDVPPLWPTSNVAVTGKWMAAAAFNANTPTCADPAAYCLGNQVTVNAAGGVHPSYTGPELPLDWDKDGKPDFPAVDFNALPGKMSGTVTSKGPYAASVSKVHNGNLVLTGTQAEPIVISGDVYVAGDLVIKGWYTGIGSIYVAGNVYIPADLRAVRSAFPYSDDEGQALAKAKDQVANKTADALGIATANSIFIADLQKQQNSDAGNENVTVYTHPATPANRTAQALGTYNVFNWFPGGNAGFNGLYENAVSCLTGAATQIGSFNMIEGFLYARNTIAGISRRASYTIRGGVVADYFHVVSGASRCGANPSPVHGRPANRSYVEYDYRLKTGGLRVLEHVAEAFPLN